MLKSQMELVSLPKGQTLFEMGEVPSHVYFPISAIVSMLIDMEDGASIETYMLGNTCMVGAAALGQPSFYRACVRSAGQAYRMPAQAMLNAKAKCPVYMQGALAATHRMFMQLSQAIVCGKRHTIEQQLIRWMLITLDRTSRNHIQITHQELSEVLGFRREGITLALGKLMARGSVQVSRGEIVVHDRFELEASSCECYWIGEQRKRPSTVCLDGEAHKRFG